MSDFPKVGSMAKRADPHSPEAKEAAEERARLRVECRAWIEEGHAGLPHGLTPEQVNSITPLSTGELRRRLRDWW
jgi:hypothetical protein